MSGLLPLFLKLQGRPVLVVGGGVVAAGKLASLLEAGARVTVVAPEVRANLPRPDVRVLRRAFWPEDLEGMWLAVAAATPEVNRLVARAAEERRVFVNAVDDAASASAYAGAVIRRGGMTVAISTEGEAPALAGLLREGLEALVPPETDRWVDVARAARKSWQADGVPFGRRRPLLLQALNGLYEARTVSGQARSA